MIIKRCFVVISLSDKLERIPQSVGSAQLHYGLVPLLFLLFFFSGFRGFRR
jgi:hypothetical protein